MPRPRQPSNRGHIPLMSIRSDGTNRSCTVIGINVFVLRKSGHHIQSISFQSGRTTTTSVDITDLGTNPP